MIFQSFEHIITVVSVQQISPTEQARRARLVKEATHSIEMEGGVFTDAALHDMQLYLDGVISSAELVQLTRKRYGLEWRV